MLRAHLEGTGGGRERGRARAGRGRGGGLRVMHAAIVPGTVDFIRGEW